VDGLAGELGQHIKTRREKSGRSVEEAALRADVTPATWWRIEQGTRLVSMAKQLEQIAAGLGSDPTDLLRL
jgi:transcriptional regulator with XRE-family HTH domain